MRTGVMAEIHGLYVGVGHASAASRQCTTEAQRAPRKARGPTVNELESVAPAEVDDDPLTREIIGAAIAVHKALGPGLLESAYESCLAFELQARGIRFERQRELPIVYRGHKIDCSYRLDFLIEERVILELKAVEKLEPLHQAQLLTYLRLSGKRVGLLLNFNTPYLRDGIKRMVL